MDGLWFDEVVRSFENWFDRTSWPVGHVDTIVISRYGVCNSVDVHSIYVIIC